MRSSIPPAPAQLSALAIADTGFIFDPRTGHSFSTNSVGVAVLKQLRDGTGLPEIVVHLKQEYEDVGSQVERDVHDFVRALKDFGWGVPEIGAQP